MFKKMLFSVISGVLIFSFISTPSYAALSSRNLPTNIAAAQQETARFQTSWYSGYNQFYSPWRSDHNITSPTQQASNPTIEKVIETGYSYLGTPYKYGSDRSTTTTFDCSDFVKHIFNEAAEIVLPSNSRTQGSYIRENSEITTNWQELKRGDLMFFMSYEGSDRSDYTDKQPLEERITHVGIYLGDGQILHTYSEKSGGVRVDSFENTHFEYRFLFGGSVIE